QHRTGRAPSRRDGAGSRRSERFCTAGRNSLDSRARELSLFQRWFVFALLANSEWQLAPKRSITARGSRRRIECRADQAGCRLTAKDRGPRRWPRMTRSSPLRTAGVLILSLLLAGHFALTPALRGGSQNVSPRQAVFTDYRGQSPGTLHKITPK